MAGHDAFLVFDSLTAKQHEALDLASSHLTSKQIAIALGVAPVTIDKRIEAVRARLNHISRADLLRLYRQWETVNKAGGTYDQVIGDLTILGMESSGLPLLPPQSDEPHLAFEDNFVFDERASWDRGPIWLRPEFKPSDLSMGGKLAFMLLGAVAVMITAVLCMAFIDALMSILKR